jgi:polyvinyl alcohol dehydrogenase (cytochrome)
MSDWNAWEGTMRKMIAAALGVAMLAGVASAQPPARPPGAAGQEGAGGPAATAAQAARGQTLYEQKCKSCHEPAIERAPTRAGLAARYPEEVIAALKTGMMQPMAQGMNDADITAVAVFLTGRAPGPGFNNAAEAANRCLPSNKFNAAGPSWNGWSPDAQNTRVAVGTPINAASAPKLKVKWSFAYQGGRYGQPTVVGNRVFITSSSGQQYALDKNTGCVAWAFSTSGTGVRVTASVGKNAKAPSGYAVYFGDYGRNIYALDANSGKQLWKLNVEKHPRGVLTGAPVLYNGTLYVPVSSWEETISSLAAYECCTARGSVVAIDVTTGKQKWKTYTMPEPKPFKKSPAGAQMYGPAGAAIWSAPTIDPKRNQLYVATGDSYTDVKEDRSDAIMAMDLTTGAIKWTHQVTQDDNFLTGCNPGRAGVNCPTPVGPDHDFGAAPILKKTRDGKDVVLSGQKSGQVYAMDPADGKILWQTRVGKGSALGGVEWGMAADGDNLYVAVNQGGLPSLTAFRLTDGAQIWQHRAPDAKCSFTSGRCGNGYSAPPTLANGVLYGPNQDGHLRAFEAKTGKLIWDYDTAASKYDTVNGVKGQRGGNLDGTGITFAGSMGYLMAGFNGASGTSGPDNVLLAFSVDGK